MLRHSNIHMFRVLNPKCHENEYCCHCRYSMDKNSAKFKLYWASLLAADSIMQLAVEIPHEILLSLIQYCLDHGDASMGKLISIDVKLKLSHFESIPSIEWNNVCKLVICELSFWQMTLMRHTIPHSPSSAREHKNDWLLQQMLRCNSSLSFVCTTQSLHHAATHQKNEKMKQEEERKKGERRKKNGNGRRVHELNNT